MKKVPMGASFFMRTVFVSFAENILREILYDMAGRSV